jgi:DNA-binding MarR family transcriptional regulator
MESDQLVVRRQSQQDRRKRVLQVTEAGYLILERVKEYHGNVSQRLLAALTPDQRRQLTGMLQTLLKAAQVQRSQRETVRTVADTPAPYALRDIPAA